jgi:hypothetical protein
LGVFWAGRYLAGHYPARARARARAPGSRVALEPPALLTIGDYAQRLFARAQLWCFFCKFSLFENVSFLVNPKIGGIFERYCSDLQ